ncbi:MAG TPA: hypothetical protein VJ453_06085 [Terriglobales bacterium]|jgi:hypothetical protein|nr:hypothetical protein [Terriglobales bacterium]
MDASEILQSLYLAGFELQTSERFPRVIGVFKGECIALLEPKDNGLRFMGRPGWRMGDVIGVLTTKNNQKVFQAKDQVVEATPERLKQLADFEAELLGLLQRKSA